MKIGGSGRGSQYGNPIKGIIPITEDKSITIKL